MNENIYEFPVFLLDTELHSELRIFLDQIRDNQLLGFRNLYNTNKESFFNIITEMTLRGFKFRIKSNLFPNVNFDTSSYIVCKDFNGKNFKNIDFNLIGLGMINKFEIQNDGFFHKIPIEGFLYLNPNIDIDYFKKLLKKEGFFIEQNKNNEYCATSKKKSLISLVYSESKFNLFKKFCEENYYIFMEDLNLEIINNLINIQGFGLKKINDILEKYEQWLTNNNKSVETKMKETIDFHKYNLKLEFVFSESKYNKFMNFCLERNLECVSDLSDNLLLEFSKLPSIGKKKIEDIRKVLKYLSTEKIDENETFYFEKCEELIVLDLSINEYFNLFNINSNTFIELYLQDIIHKKYNNLKNYCVIEDLKLLESYLKIYAKADSLLGEVIEKNMKSEKERIIILHRLNGDKTLEQVAKELNLTRERVRQIANKLVVKITDDLNKEMFFSYIKLIFWDKKIITKEELMKKFPCYSSLLMEIIKEGNTCLYWNDKFNFYSFSKLQLKEPSFFNEESEYCLTKDILSECMEIWNDIVEDLNKNKIIDILFEVYHFNFYGEIVSKTVLSKTKCIEALLVYYIDEIKLDIDGCNKIRKMALEKMGINLYSDSDRNIEAKARTNKNLLLIDSKTFKYLEENTGLLSLENEVEKYLDQYFEENDQIDSKILYNSFMDKCRNNGLYTDLGLYSLMKKYCQDRFTFAKGNEKCIYKSVSSRVSRQEQLRMLFDSNNPVITKSDILEKISWPISKLENTIANSQSFFCGSLSKVFCKDYIILSNEEKGLLLNMYNRCVENNYCHLNKLYFELKFDSKFNKILRKFKIENGTDLGVLIPIVKDVRIWYYMAFSKDSKEESIIDVLTTKFPDFVYRQEIIQYLENNKYDLRQITYIITLIDTNDRFINIDRDYFINSEAFEIDQNAINRLLEYIGDEEYILLNSLKGYRKHLPKINYKWTPTLMSELLSRNGYRIISKLNKDYRYDYSIVVKDSSTILTLSDLVYKILRFEYTGRHDVLSIIEYMNERKVFSNKTIPFEILQDDRFSLDEFNILHWRD